MPHTSRRQRNRPAAHLSKRVIVEAQDGWSTVSRAASNAHNTSLCKQSEDVTQPPAHSVGTFNGRRLRGPPEQLWECFTPKQQDLLIKNVPGLPPLSSFSTAVYSSQEVATNYRRRSSQWSQSSSAPGIKSILEDRVPPSVLRKIKKATMLGSGSFSSWHSQHAAQWQLAAFMEIGKIIAASGGKTNEVELYAQEPSYNETDKAFLAAQGIKVVDAPAASEAVDETTFVFGPHIPVTIFSASMREGKAGLMICNDLAEHIDNVADHEEYFGYLQKWCDDPKSEIPDAHIKDQFMKFVAEHKTVGFPQPSSNDDDRSIERAFNGLSIYWKDDKKSLDGDAESLPGSLAKVSLASKS